jgi:uncharacterized delta-60 repeat protein
MFIYNKNIPKVSHMIKALLSIPASVFFTFSVCAQSIDSTKKIFPILDPFYGIVSDLEIQDDQKIIAQGMLDLVDTVKVAGIVRFNPDGTLDPTYNYTSGFDSYDIETQLQRDNKLLVWGHFKKFDNKTVTGGIARLTENGLIDASFSVTEGIDRFGHIRSVDFQDDGKIIMGGYFSSFNSKTRQNLVRLNKDGSLDESFSTESIKPESVQAVKVLKDGKIMISAVRKHENGTTYFSLIRLNSDGSLDEAFQTGNFSMGYVSDFSITNDGKIIAVGSFDKYNEVDRKNIVCLNTDGTINNDFFYSSGSNGIINKIHIQKNGKIILYGSFDLY